MGDVAGVERQARAMTCVSLVRRGPAPERPASRAVAPTQRAATGHHDVSRRLIAGRYRVQCVLGKGGMGVVWQAWDELLLRTVALKQLTLPVPTVDRARSNARVLSEARAASQITHPGVVRVYDVVYPVDMDHERPWIVMEALSGPTLAQQLRRDGRLSVAQVVDVGLQVLGALKAIHAAGVTHRDLTPRNVQWAAGNRVVITDFGIAAPLGTGTGVIAGQVYGSPPYLAPEAITERRFGPASDLFAFGVTLYAAVEGREPFKDATPVDTALAVLQRPPRPMQHAGSLTPVLLGLLAKDPQRRLGLGAARALLRQVRSRCGR
jgi:serine/threonine protein kinase